MMTNQNAVVVGFDLDFLIEPICQLEANNIINVTKWIVGGDDTNVVHENKIWWWDIVFNIKYSQSNRFLTDEELNYLLPKFAIFQQHIVREKFLSYILYKKYKILYLNLFIILKILFYQRMLI